MSVYVWNNVSPDDGCTLVLEGMRAALLTDVAAALRGWPDLQNTTAAQLLKQGGARKAKAGGVEAAEAGLDVVFWLGPELEHGLR